MLRGMTRLGAMRNERNWPGADRQLLGVAITKRTSAPERRNPIIFRGRSEYPPQETPRQGDTVPVTLRFEKAGEVTAELAVAAIGAKSLHGEGGEAMDHGSMDHARRVRCGGPAAPPEGRRLVLLAF